MKAIFVFIIIFLSNSSFGQETQELLMKEALEKATDYKSWDSTKIAIKYNEIQITKPTKREILNLCDFVEGSQLDFYYYLMQVSGVTKSERETIVGILKVQKFWNLYKDSCYCNTEGLNVKNGNILLMSVASNFMAFPTILLLDFGININYITKPHKLTILDFTKNEIQRLEKLGGQKERVDELKGIYDYLRKELKCNHKSEL